MLLGLGHRKQVGKDTLAQMIAKYSADTVVASFAQPLKHVANVLFNWAGVSAGAFYDQNPLMKEEMIPMLNMTVRDLYLRLGKDMRAIHPDVYVNALLTAVRGQATHPNMLCVITDVRYPNEVEAIKRMGGQVFKIERPSIEITHDDADDALEGFTGWDRVLVNAGSLADFEALALSLVKELFHG